MAEILPFQLLGLSTSALKDTIIARGEELTKAAESEKQKLQYERAVKELTGSVSVRFGHELREIARRKELAVATSRMLKFLFPEGDDVTVNPGRYSFISEIIEAHASLLESLLNNDRKMALRAWPEAIKSKEDDPRFLHGLAVVYRERAITCQEAGNPNDDYWLFSTALWAYLLCSDEFWVYYSRKRLTDRDTGERHDLNNEGQDELMSEIFGSLLSLQSSLGNRAFASGQYSRTQLHLRCLDICRQGQAMIEQTLKTFSLSAKLKPLAKNYSLFSELAADTVDDFCRGRLQEAKKLVADAEAIKDLPEGIRKNYAGAIAHLDILIGLNVPVIRILQQCLDWYNEWCYDLYVTQQLEEVRNLILPAGKVADQLIPLCTKGNAFTPENQALSQHFLFRGFSKIDPQEGVSEYEEALAWNVANENAKQLLGDAHKAVVMKQINRAVECVEREDFTAAYGILEAVEEQLGNDEEGLRQVTEARGFVFFKHADLSAKDGQFRESLKLAKKAAKLIPHEEAIQQLVKEMSELAPEEKNIGSLKAAREAYERKQYDQAISSASQIPQRSKFHGDACRLQSAAYFHRGIESANQKQFGRAISDIEKALSLTKVREDRKVISEQLEILLRANLAQKINAAFEQNNWQRGEAIIREELKKDLPRQFKKELTEQLAMALNAHAIELLNAAAEAESSLAGAINEIMNIVQEQSGVTRA